MEDGIDIEFLQSELKKFEVRLKAIQKKYKKMEDMLKSKKVSKEYMIILGKSFYIQGKLSVLEGTYKHKMDISYIG